ncbi:Protein RALF-like 2 [Camellia lanceoleosa]|uniref:Protein RALF-like 2 n=1 Tax=Camellia lanceoleosa TaxID=1840588 RepID=A0ACC0F4F0_9ERIC|nr:Protein RALF-like 2 [Camellia lanceoleosa]
MKARWLCLVLISMAVAATTMSAVDAQRPIKYINLCHQPGGCPPDLPNLTPRQAANPYRRGCSKITRCRPDEGRVESDNKNPKKRATVYHHALSAADVDDEIDTFHKHRDIVPLDINDNSGESDEDDEHPVFDFKDANDDDEDEYENIDDDTSLVAKIAR